MSPSRSVRFASLTVVVLLVQCTASGCAWVASKYRVDPLLKAPACEEPLDLVLIRKSTPPVDIRTLCFPNDEVVLPTASRRTVARHCSAPCKTKPDGTVEESAYHKVVSEPDPQKAMELRNRLLALLLQRSDVRCEQHKGDIIAQASNSNFLLTVVALGLTSAGTATAVEAAKTALSAAAAAVTGTQAAMNEQIYQQLFAGTIVNAITVSRAEKLKTIEASRLQTTTVYTVDDMIRDVQDYHQRCSFYDGLVRLHETVEHNRALQSELTKAKQQYSEQFRARMEALDAAVTKLEAELKKAREDKVSPEALQAIKDKAKPLEVDRAAIEADVGLLAAPWLVEGLAGSKLRLKAIQAPEPKPDTP